MLPFGRNSLELAGKRAALRYQHLNLWKVRTSAMPRTRQSAAAFLAGLGRLPFKAFARPEHSDNLLHSVSFLFFQF